MFRFNTPVNKLSVIYQSSSQRKGEGTEEYDRLNAPHKKLSLSGVKQISPCQHATYDGPSF